MQPLRQDVANLGCLGRFASCGVFNLRLFRWSHRPALRSTECGRTDNYIVDRKNRENPSGLWWLRGICLETEGFAFYG